MIIEKPERVIPLGLYQLGETKLRCISKKKFRRNHGPWCVGMRCLTTSADHDWRVGESYNCYEGTIGNNYNFVFEIGSIWEKDKYQVTIFDIDEYEAAIGTVITAAPEGAILYRPADEIHLHCEDLYNKWKLLKVR